MTEPQPVQLAPGETPPPAQLAIPQGVDWELPSPAPDEDAAHQLDEDAAHQLDDALLFGAFSPGSFQPTPVVSIGGVDLAPGTTAGQIVGQVVVDGLTCHWGRDQVLKQADPPTASLSLFDATKTWATGRKLIGQLVTFRWEGTPPDGTSPSTGVFFRGRIQKVKVTRKTVRAPDGTRVTGSLVTMPLVSILNDLANIKPTTAWPEETMEARRSRVATAAAAVLPGGVGMRDYWKTPNAEPVTVANQRSIWAHLVSIFDSSGADRWVYFPDVQIVQQMPRRDYFSVRGVAGLWWDQVGDTLAPGRAGLGAYARSYAITPAGGSPGTPHYLPADGLRYDDGLELTPEQRISRVLITNPDGSQPLPYPDRTTLKLVDDVDEVAEGVRQVNVDTIVTWNSWADQAALDVAAMAQKEARAWKLGPVTWETKRTDGFETYQQARLYLWGGETTSNVFLQRSYLPEYGIRPVFGVMGMVITYRDQAWTFDLDLAPIVTTLPQHAITWDEIDDGTSTYEVQWWDEDHPHGLHESLTYEDLRYVSTGMGVVTIPADTGWDEVIN